MGALRGPPGGRIEKLSPLCTAKVAVPNTFRVSGYTIRPLLVWAPRAPGPPGAPRWPNQKILGTLNRNVAVPNAFSFLTFLSEDVLSIRLRLGWPPGGPGAPRGPPGGRIEKPSPLCAGKVAVPNTFRISGYMIRPLDHGENPFSYDLLRTDRQTDGTLIYR